MEEANKLGEEKASRSNKLGEEKASRYKAIVDLHLALYNVC